MQSWYIVDESDRQVTWKSRPLTMTRSPTLRLPLAMPSAVSTMEAARAPLKMTFCPRFRADRLY